MLYICPTPIGNLEDVTLRVLSVLAAADLVACEDTRHTRILLGRHGIDTRVVSFHEHNEEQRLATLLPLLREGRDIAVVSDAGMPGLSDPGFTLVRACVDHGIPVTVLPGPSAVPTAVVASGLPADRFAFVGFLLRGAAKLTEQIAVFDGTGAAVVAFEAPRRLRATLKAVADRWPERQVAVCRELSKLHEQVVRGTAAEAANQLPHTVRGEIVLVLEPAGRPGTATLRPRRPRAGAEEQAHAQVAAGELAGDERMTTALRDLLDAGVGTKRAAGIVASLTGLPRRQVYHLVLAIREETERREQGAEGR